MIRRAAAVALAGAALLFPAEAARACSCFAQTPAGYLEAASVVVAGEVTLVERGIDGLEIATISVQRIYKGRPGPAIQVEAGASGDICGIGFAERTRYVVFAVTEGSVHRTGLCAGTTDDVEFLERAGIRPVATAGTPAAQPIVRPAPAAPAERSRTTPIAAAWAAALCSAAAWIVLRPA